MQISVIGLGYVGLPLALLADIKGFRVLGVEKSDSLIKGLRSRSLRTEDPIVNEMIKKHNIEVKKNPENSNIYIICVPTPVKNKYFPDLSFVESAVKDVADVLDNGELVIIESTINPGACEDYVVPLLDKAEKKYYLAHCPERINPGDKKWTLSNIPRIVGGICDISTKRAREFYEKILDAPVMAVKGIKEAEASKILENTFRDINIAFVNEMAQSFYRLRIDIMEVIKAASTKPFGFLPHFPGVGVGGHCIAIDPYYMIEKGKEIGFEHSLLSLARKINSGMPRFTTELVQDSLNELGYCIKGTSIAVLGLAYKPDIADDRESPGYEVIKLLSEKGADLKIFDSYFPKKSNVSNLAQALKNTVCAVIITAHKEFLEDISIYADVKLIIDGRNCLPADKIRKSGIKYKGIGI